MSKIIITEKQFKQVVRTFKEELGNKINNI